MPKRIAVIGASGFVGAALTEYLLQRHEFSVVPFCHSTGGAARLAYRGIRIERLDLLDRAGVAKTLDGFDCVVNCSRGDDKVMLEGLSNLLHAARNAGVKKFVHLSSVAVYGDPPDPASISEDGPTQPAPGSYGDVKLMQDRLVQRAAHNGLSAVILCPPNITGRGSDFLIDIIRSIECGRFRLVESGQYPINIVDVDNLCACIASAIGASIGDGRRLFVCEPASINWRQFCDELAPVIRGDANIPAIDEGVLAAAPAAPQRAMRKAYFGGAVKHLVSDEVREAMRLYPTWAAIEGGVKRVIHRLGRRAEDDLRHRVNGPVRIAVTAQPDTFDRNLVAQQLRKVRHDPSRCERELHFLPPLSFSESMQSFRDWYNVYMDAGSPEWALLGEPMQAAQVG